MGKRDRDIEGLTAKQVRFVQEYEVCLSPTHAADRAGYAKPNVAGAKLMKSPAVIKAIRARTKKVTKKFDLTKELVLLELFYLATRKASDFVDAETGRLLPLNKLNKRAQACVDGFEQTETISMETGERKITTKIKLSPKAAAVDMALRHKGLFAPDRVEATVRLDWDSALNKLAEQAKGQHGHIDIVQARLANPGKPLVELLPKATELPTKKATQYTVDEVLDEQDQDGE